MVLDDGRAFTGDLPGPAYAEPASAEAVATSWDSLVSAGAREVYPGHGPIRPFSQVLHHNGE